MPLNLEFEVLTPVAMKRFIFWDIACFSLLKIICSGGMASASKSKPSKKPA
jgi:hypothetical protein